MKISVWIVLWGVLLLSGPLLGQDNRSVKSGDVIPSIACTQDTTLSYALYVPQHYRHKQPLPILFCFDPHGDGAYAVGKMVSAADSLGYIVCGSNNSKNGQPIDDGIRFFSAYLHDLQKVVQIDPKRVYCCGFSGGARVASAIGLTTPGICGVIGCGAGFPGLQRSEVVPVDYLGVCGNADLNLSELQSLMEKLDPLPIPHHLLIFDGIHAWPEGLTIQDMFNWMEIRAMVHHLKEIDTGYLQQVETHLIHRMQELADHSRFYMASLTGHYALYLLDPLKPVTLLKQRLREIEQDESFLREKQETEQSGLWEQSLQQHFLQAMGDKSLDWWKNELITLRKAANESHPALSADQLMNRRLLAWLSLVAYSQANKALQTGTRSQALHWIALYKTIDPDNPEPEKMRIKALKMK